MKLARIVLFIALATACSKKKDDGGAGAASGSAPTEMAGSGSAAPAAGSGSAPAAGSGSAVAAAGSDQGSAAAGSAAGSGSAAAGSGSAVAAGSGSAAGSGEEKSAWDKLTHEEKADFMKKNVVPAMKIEFQKFDPKKYEKFGCKTCHGKDPKESKFKMPTADLPKLDFAKLEAGKQEPKTAEWMAKVVKPQMAKILGEKEMDPANPKAGGFACLSCHEQKK